ncbi:hypothetical protein NLY43_21095 [Mesorhizobium sp. C416B]|uniref:hypothetical protein n=1 Tax=unclassified Mesorhizobium TaxID=325217 RepID=UPI0003CF0E6E|nr:MULTISPECIES: hypothetical protein [unclassified Mesorhizobium]ESX42103.1 hypothetical protein X762_29745 [Mesorhizobium sp. LSHC426A00]ESX56430.1 hypothetical protein X761_09340 [Mesorhizobium sp. LSHC424B00]ESX71470.1 hypothetical protein X758_16450 [Mesorhizobium sp. LSHC416B00]WJI61106.1 hypothetical protein NLY43_21095 [Mesorhizobium sp. C416B]
MILEGKRFDVEHALTLYALSYVTIPAEGLYDSNGVKQFSDVTKKCHIYIVGFVPKMELLDITLEGQSLRMFFRALGKVYELPWKMDEGVGLVRKDEQWFLSKDGMLASPPPLDRCTVRLNRKFGTGKFLVKYIGQAYGKDGSRSALDRLMKHEKLQEIAIKGVPEGYRFQVLMLAIAPVNQVVTIFNPRAEDDSQSEKRIGQGLDKLFGTSEKERVALYEAALIRYFLPTFNREFSDSFASTNLKILQDCYEKDFSAVSAEINFDDFPFSLYSESVIPKEAHLAFFDLHEDQARKVFFAGA